MLVVYAHPNKEKNCGEILKQVIAHLKENEVGYEILDLYEMKYDPVLYSNEHYTSGNNEINVVNRKIQRLVKNNRYNMYVYTSNIANSVIL